MATVLSSCVLLDSLELRTAPAIARWTRWPYTTPDVNITEGMASYTAYSRISRMAG
jgi:hypothetical protein